MNLLVKLLTKNLKPDLSNTEKEIYSGGANLFRGSLAVGGKLILTDKRLIFLPHKFNLGFGGKDEYIELSNIYYAREIMTADLINNGLGITLKNNTELKFVVSDRPILIRKLKESEININ